MAGDSFPVTPLGVAAALEPRVVREAGRACDGTATPRAARRSPPEPRPGPLPGAAGKLVFSSLIVSEMGAAGEEAPAVRGLVVVCLVCVTVCVSACVCFFLWGIYLLFLLPCWFHRLKPAGFLTVCGEKKIQRIQRNPRLDETAKIRSLSPRHPEATKAPTCPPDSR